MTPQEIAEIKAQALEEAADRGDKEMDHYYWGYDEVSDTLRKWAQELREPAASCPTRLMDGRNELRCWLPQGHEGDCR